MININLRVIIVVKLVKCVSALIPALVIAAGMGIT
jgi:hypothetical protein